MMWQLHMRRVGVEARADLVPGVSKGGSGGSPSEGNDGRDDPEDPPKDDGEPSAGPSTDSQLHPTTESSESHSLGDQLLSDARVRHLVNEDIMVLFLRHLQEILFLHLFPLYLGSLCITLNNCWIVRREV